MSRWIEKHIQGVTLIFAYKKKKPKKGRFYDENHRDRTRLFIASRSGYRFNLTFSLNDGMIILNLLDNAFSFVGN